MYHENRNDFCQNFYIYRAYCAINRALGFPFYTRAYFAIINLDVISKSYDKRETSSRICSGRKSCRWLMIIILERRRSTRLCLFRTLKIVIPTVSRICLSFHGADLDSSQSFQFSWIIISRYCSYCANVQPIA